MLTQEKITDILCAGALGDAFGYAVEFHSWAKISREYGPGGIRHIPANPVASDDTQMTLFACEGLIYGLTEGTFNNGPFKLSMHPFDDPQLNLNHLTKWQTNSFLNWYHTQFNANGDELSASMFRDNAELFHRREPGNTCLSSLKRIKDNEIVENNSKGCGGTMRAAPYAFICDFADLDFIWELSCRSAKITHHNTDGWASSGALSVILASLINGETDYNLIISDVVERCRTVGAHDTAALLILAQNFKHTDMHPITLTQVFGEGWTGDEALAIGVYAGFKAMSVMEAIIIATNHSGDSDSTASIAAQIAAARMGMNEMEYAAFDSIDLAKVTKETATKLYGVLDVQ